MEALIESIAFNCQLLFCFLCLSRLCLQLGLKISQFTAKVLYFTLFAVLDQFDFVLRSLELAMKLGLLLLPVVHL